MFIKMTIFWDISHFQLPAIGIALPGGKLLTNAEVSDSKATAGVDCSVSLDTVKTSNSCVHQRIGSLTI